MRRKRSWWKWLETRRRMRRTREGISHASGISIASKIWIGERRDYQTNLSPWKIWSWLKKNYLCFRKYCRLNVLYLSMWNTSSNCTSWKCKCAFNAFIASWLEYRAEYVQANAKKIHLAEKDWRFNYCLIPLFFFSKNIHWSLSRGENLLWNRLQHFFLSLRCINTNSVKLRLVTSERDLFFNTCCQTQLLMCFFLSFITGCI